VPNSCLVVTLRNHRAVIVEPTVQDRGRTLLRGMGVLGAWTGGTASVQGWRVAGAGTLIADGTSRAGRVLTPADDLSVTAQQLVGALAEGHRRGQLFAGRDLSLAVAGRVRACRVAEAQAGQHTQAVGIQGQNGPGPCEQVNAVGPRRPDARVGAPWRPGHGKLGAPDRPDRRPAQAGPGAPANPSSQPA